ncbi:hypothetical protein [Agreia sp. COWG]|uniref:hypothetical protein n=1 Tax=Agreia sp. COWG TaxID=2773266 RepID=UPI001925FCDD|nr:hypothetical protein [Agreia sp. COWG]CAD5999264.1 conserved protein of unknown function [Agreia sp. COWG]
MELTLAKVTPFLPNLTETQRASVTAWATVLQVKLNSRYGNRITDALEPLFVSYAADALLRRLKPTDKRIAQQSIGPAGVRYTDKNSLGGWFWPEEIDDMDSVCGLSGAQSYRMPAPDGIRYGNLVGGIVLEDGDVLVDEEP